MKVRLVTVTALPAGGSVLAQTTADGLPLSKIIAGIESQSDFTWFEAVDCDHGHWEIEYRARSRSIRRRASPAPAGLVVHQQRWTHGLPYPFGGP